MNTFISFFTASEKRYVLFLMIDDPQVAKDLVYNYRGTQIKASEMRRLECSLYSWQNNRTNWTNFSHKQKR